MPDLVERHPDAVCSKLSINDLFLFRDIYTGLLNGQDLEEISKTIGLKEPIGKRKYEQLFEKIEKAIWHDDAKRGFVRASARNKEAGQRSPASQFHARLSRILVDLSQLVHECQKGQQQVVIQGSEYSILCLLPRMLEQSRFLENNPQVVLDIRRAYWPEFLNNLENGLIDLAIGPAAEVRPNIERIHLLTVRRAIIYPLKNYKFECNKEGFEIVLGDLGHETLFVFHGMISWGLNLEEKLPRTVGKGRRIYVDSITHMYQYVSRGLGAALGFELLHAPYHDQTKIGTKPLDEIHLPAAHFYLYVLKDRIGKQSSVPDKLRDVIIEEASKLNN